MEKDQDAAECFGFARFGAVVPAGPRGGGWELRVGAVHPLQTRRSPGEGRERAG